jgi:hypothetical protein
MTELLDSKVKLAPAKFAVAGFQEREERVTPPPTAPANDMP